MANSSAIWNDDTSPETNEIIRPFWTIKNLDNDKKVLEWMNSTYGAEVKRVQPYREQALKHIALFKGKFYPSGGGSKIGYAEASSAGLGVMPTRVSKLIVNYLYDAIVQRVSQITKNKPAVDVSPANDDYSDRVSAKMVKYLIAYLFYKNEFDPLSAEVALSTYMMGETYGAVLWNPDKGDLTQEWKDEEALAANESRPPRVLLRDEKGNVVTGENGEPLYIEKPVKVGDIEYKVFTPLDTIVQNKGRFSDADYLFYEEYKDVDEVRADYPNHAEEIVSEGADDGLTKLRSAVGARGGAMPGKVLLRHFWHRPNKYLASGRYVLSTSKVVLENRALPPGLKSLPIVRLTDIDVPAEQEGMSFFVHGKSINATINDFTSMIRENAILLSRPKWVYPTGSLVKKDALSNQITSIEFKGPVEPKIVAPPPMNQELAALRTDLKGDLQLLMGGSTLRQGQIPANVRSAMAMQYLDEQDEQRANSSSAKYAAWIKGMVELTIEVASAYYEKGDRRLIPIIGRNNRYINKEFDPRHLQKALDVRVNNSSGMPTSKAARTEMLVELKKVFPTLVRDEQVADMLQWTDTDRFYDAATVAVESAEAENEAMLNEEAVSEPEPYEHHVTHWTIHMRDIQNRSFKISTPEHVQAAMIAHTMATEMLMIETARKNPAFAIELVKLPQFPAFYDISFEDRVLLDRARSGNPLTLVEIDMLYQTGSLPQGLNAAPPPAGGTPNPNNPMYNQLTEGMVPPAGSEQAAPQAPSAETPGHSAEQAAPDNAQAESEGNE